MNDLERALANEAERHQPPEDWLEHVYRRARARRRNKRIAAGVVALGVFAALAIFLIRELANDARTAPAGPPSSAPERSCGPGTRVQPTGWWRGDGSGADAVGGHDAVLHGDATFAPGLIGQAFTFDGEGDWAEVPDDPALNVGTGDFTISLWVRFTGTHRNQILVEDYVEKFDRYKSVGWILQKHPDGFLIFGLSAAGGLNSQPVDFLDQWVHVVARRKDRVLSIFINGTLDAQHALGHPRLPAADSPASLKFGHRNNEADTPGSLDPRGMYLNGQLDEIQLYIGRGLSDAAIRGIFETQSACAM